MSAWGKMIHGCARNRERVAAFAVLLLVASLAGCSLALPWSRPPTRAPGGLCIPGAAEVRSKDSEILARVFARVRAAAQADLGRTPVDAVVIRVPPSASVAEDDGMALCRARDRATVTMSEARLARVLQRPNGEQALARGIAHLLGLLVWHPQPTPLEPSQEAEAALKADELGVYYFERAGYDCARWETSKEYLRHVRMACNLAKQGFRTVLPPPPAAEPSR